MAELDGNVLAGSLARIFTGDATSAVFVCAGCGGAGAVATLRVWVSGPGEVARCPHCTDVILRIVRAPGRTVLDLSGALRLELPD